MAVRAEDLHRFSVDQYLDFAAADPAALDRTELVDGVIFDVSPESILHADAVRWIDRQLDHAFPSRVRSHGSVQFSTSMWEPDVYVVREGANLSGDYPQAAELELVVEVCLSTAARDLGDKLRAYAADAVPVYWVVMPTTPGWAIVHREPTGLTYQHAERVELPLGYRDLEARLGA